MPLPMIAAGLGIARRAGSRLLRSRTGRRLAGRAGRAFGRRRGRSRGLTPSRLSKIMMLQMVLGRNAPAVKIAGLKLISGRF